MRLTDAAFDRVVADSPVPVLVDFYADWCGPCKMMAPVLDHAAREHTGRVLVAKVDTDANPELARKFRIASIPTLIAFRGGAEVARELGALPRTRLNALIERALG
jgi:thioredoxin